MKKNHELIHLEHFKEVCPSFPEGKIESTEKPDFIVHTQENLLGIEHTEIYQLGPSDGTSLQAQDSLAQKVVEKAHSLYLEQHSQPLLVQIHFNHRIRLRKTEVDRLAKAIMHLVETTPIEPGLSITIMRSAENSINFPNEIAMLHINAHSLGKETKWFCSSAGWIPEVTPEDIQKKINHKETKLSSYKSRCSEIWLLLVIDDLRIPSSVDSSREASTYQYSTRFDRVFIFWNSTRCFIELLLAKDNITNVNTIDKTY